MSSVCKLIVSGSSPRCTCIFEMPVTLGAKISKLFVHKGDGGGLSGQKVGVLTGKCSAVPCVSVAAGLIKRPPL